MTTIKKPAKKVSTRGKTATKKPATKKPVRRTSAAGKSIVNAAPQRTNAVAHVYGRIGEKLKAGIYAGTVRGERDGPDQYLFVIEATPPKAMSYPDAMKWAESVGGSLPTRAEQAVLFGNVPELFEKYLYWSNAQSAGYEGSAWCQSFDDGLQYDALKSNELRARAVRRLPIE